MVLKNVNYYFAKINRYEISWLASQIENRIVKKYLKEDEDRIICLQQFEIKFVICIKYSITMFKKIWSYLTFKKQPEFEQADKSYLKMMHGINRISILMFLIGMIVVIIKIVRL